MTKERKGTSPFFVWAKHSGSHASHCVELDGVCTGQLVNAPILYPHPLDWPCATTSLVEALRVCLWEQSLASLSGSQERCGTQL